MKSKPVSTIITGVGHYVPEMVITSEDIDKRVRMKGVNVGAMIESITGVKERRHAPPDTDSTDLAAEAGRIALKRAGIHPEEVDTLIFAAVSRDLIEPATANILQNKLYTFQ